MKHNFFYPCRVFVVIAEGKIWMWLNPCLAASTPDNIAGAAATLAD